MVKYTYIVINVAAIKLNILNHTLCLRYYIYVLSGAMVVLRTCNEKDAQVETAKTNIHKFYI